MALNKIDSKGAFIGTITEIVAALTKKSSLLQAVVRIEATKKYVEDPVDLKHYLDQGAITEAVPQWIDWTGLGEDAVGYLVLFKDQDCTEPMLNYDQLKIATGWDGVDLTFAGLKGKEVLFRMEESTYEDKTRLQMNWVDSKDASPTPELKALDPTAIAALTAKIKKGVGIKAKPAVAAKPPAKPPIKPVAAAAKPDTMAAAKAAGVTVTPDDPKLSEAIAPTTPPKTAKAPTAGCTQQEAWDTVMGKKGDLKDDDITDAWIATVNEVAEKSGHAEENFTHADWGLVRTTVLKDLALS